MCECGWGNLIQSTGGESKYEIVIVREKDVGWKALQFLGMLVYSREKLEVQGGKCFHNA